MNVSEHKTFLVRYRYDGAEWGFRLKARNIDDAKARLSMIAYGNIDGELIMSLPASSGPLATILATCRNAVNWLLNTFK